VKRDCTPAFESLLARARTGDEAAWADLYDSLAPQVLGYLRARGAADPEEVLGDVFLHIARGIDGFQGDASGFRSWVFVIATSRLHDERRRRRRKPTSPLDPGVEDQLTATTDVQAEVEQHAAMAELNALLHALTADQRTVVELRIFGGLTSQEVADTIDKPVGAVKSLYRRGVGALRRQLDGADTPAGASVLAAGRSTGTGHENVISFPTAPVPLHARAAVTRGS
jgi:RNA polymerase sigma-70 factor (ECF subfamily)